MATTMSIICLVENKYSDQKSGAEYGDADLRINMHHYEKFKWKVFYNTRKDEKQCHQWNNIPIYTYVWKFTFIKIDRIETIAICYLSTKLLDYLLFDSKLIYC